MLHSFNPYCSAIGHHWVWSSDTVACKRLWCHATSAKRTSDFLGCFETLEARALIARELRKAEMGQTTDDDVTGAW